MMRKFKLIKCYPGSPELGTVVEKQIKSQTYYHIYNDRKFGVLSEHVENNADYWEEVEDNIWWIVFKNAETMFHSWTPYRLETILSYHKGDTREYLKTKEEAESFIILNKPCLSINDIKENVSECFLSFLKRTVKSKL